MYFLKYIGIESQTFIAGMSGAVVFLTKSKNMTRTQQFLTVLSGGLSANYLTPVVANWFNLNPSVLYGIAFLLGYSGMKSVELLINTFYRKIRKDDQ
ncbi:MAG: hypothetical protein K2X95_00360 [Flavobacteriaceae bacterium]|nr:hypothetical protein [Flavobacteriaceae bacterium]